MLYTIELTVNFSARTVRVRLQLKVGSWEFTWFNSLFKLIYPHVMFILNLSWFIGTWRVYLPMNQFQVPHKNFTAVTSSCASFCDRFNFTAIDRTGALFHEQQLFSVHVLINLISWRIFVARSTLNLPINELQKLQKFDSVI